MGDNPTTVGEVARRLGVAPTLVSSLFYQRKLNPDVCPVVSGRRLIPGSYVPEIERVMRELGYLAEGKPAELVGA